MLAGLTGCSFLSETAAFNQRMLIKVRSGDNYVPDELTPVKNPCTEWHFRRIAEAPANSTEYGNWYVAWRPVDDEPHSLSLLELVWQHLRWRKVYADAPSLVRATQRAFGVFPVMIEPNLVFYGRTAMRPQDTATAPGGPSATAPPLHDAAEVTRTAAAHPDYTAAWYPIDTSLDPVETGRVTVDVRKGPTPAWPYPTRVAQRIDNHKKVKYFDPLWYQDARFSQLDDARRKVIGEHTGRSAVRVGILDTGYDKEHSAAPLYVVDGWRADANGWTRGTDQKRLWPAGESKNRTFDSNPSHGLGTIGILAGRKVKMSATPDTKLPIEDRDDWIGGAPLATVVPVRIASNPISLGTAAMAYGLDYASRVEGCDVISMSHGGSPTQAWVDAVNAAYERGTAMFAAESDFWSLAPYGIPPSGVIIPASPFYPASFRRVVGVTGVTSDEKTYAGNSLWRLICHLPLIGTWGFRGSYGPDGYQAGITLPASPDPEQMRQGLLRAQPIAAYSPNIPWLANTRSIDLDGAGTSAATPQVAAAAALWLEQNRDRIGTDWKTWKKAEAVYQVLLITAHRRHAGKPDFFLGAGSLRADDALAKTYADILAQNDALLKFPRQAMAADTFDGSKSFWRLLFRTGGSFVPPPAKRAKLDQSDTPGDSREQLTRMYYNMLLLQKWHGGALPQVGRDERGLRQRAAEMAGQTLAQVETP